MKQFTQLYTSLDQTTGTNEKIAAICDYYAVASHRDAAWATHFLCGERLQRIVSTPLLKACATESARIPPWLYQECYDAVGDLAETLSLILPKQASTHGASLAEWVEDRLLPLRQLTEAEQGRAIQEYWSMLDTQECFVMIKLLTGAFRVGVSRKLVTRALARHTRLPNETLAHRLMGSWKPTAEAFAALIDPDGTDTLDSKPYPFCLAHPIDRLPEELGGVWEFAVEWKWDGIRGQLIRRREQTFFWSQGEELMNGRWPEIESAAQRLPDGTVLDGEILAHDGKSVMSYGQLQKRIGRKKVSKQLMQEVPVAFIAFDLLEHHGVDQRGNPWTERRKKLEQLFAGLDAKTLRANDILTARSWEDLAKTRSEARKHRSEGLMLKRKDAEYAAGRTRGTWWKWKLDPMSIDAVLIYAQRGHGRRASLYTDFTFAVWDGGTLIPFAKACSGLSDAEIHELDRFVRDHTNEKFGPVRSVTPELVMEIAFEGVNESSRHKCGLAVRSPRIARWRHDKPASDANTLDDLRNLLGKPGS